MLVAGSHNSHIHRPPALQSLAASPPDLLHRGAAAPSRAPPTMELHLEPGSAEWRNESEMGNWSSSAVGVGGNSTQLPEDMRFNDGHLLSVVSYSVLLVVSATGNLTVFFLLLQRRRGSRSRINTMLLHLAIADLLVTFLLMPLEIGWAVTVSWEGGDAMCRIMAFFRTFGLFLSSFVLVCISLDRYLAVLRPMSLTAVDQRGKVMLMTAWVGSVVCSLPQIAIFHVETHPQHTWYRQCVTFNAFPSERHEIAYAAFGMVMMYGLPLVVILFSYASILAEIFRRSRDYADDADRIRRSSLGYLGKAKIRTLKMTIIIVVVFFVCWTPYYVMCCWYWYDRKSAARVDQRIQKGLFMFAVTNSCMNPIVYGAFNIRVRRAAQKVDSRARGAHAAGAGVGSGGGASWRREPADGAAVSRAGHHRCGAGRRRLRFATPPPAAPATLNLVVVKGASPPSTPGIT